MAYKSPIGLLVIRDPDGKTVTSAAFQFYQNAVDYLSQYAQSRNWEKIGSDSYRTKSNHTVSVFLMIPEGIDLNRETYLDDDKVETSTES